MFNYFKTSKEAEEWVMSFHRNRSYDELAKAKELFLDNYKNYHVIHVTGTNGKGSFVNYLKDLLMAEGYKVGTFQSPHYRIHRDRIRINGNNISEEAYLALVNKYHDYFEKYNLGMFEMTFFIAGEYFKDEKVDYAIFEVGIGGRHDCTNLLPQKDLAVICSVGLDHTDYLGPTTLSIAYNKAGIINGCNALIGELGEKEKAIVKEQCEMTSSKLYTLKPYKVIKPGLFTYDGITYQLNTIAMYQAHNASLALEAKHILVGRNDEKEKEALAKSLWEGRFEIKERNPLVIIDGAHNMHAVKALDESLDQLKGKKAILFAALKRKEYDAMINELQKHCDGLYLTSFAYPGALKEEDYENYHLPYMKNYIEGLEDLKKQYDVIVICGSLYFLSEVVTKINFSGNK